jgi:hypothetical protein
MCPKICHLIKKHLNGQKYTSKHKEHKILWFVIAAIIYSVFEDDNAMK